jgi:hypothetical protein
MTSERRTRSELAGKGEELLGLLPSPIGRREKKMTTAAVRERPLWYSHYVQNWMDCDEGRRSAPLPEWAVRASLVNLARYVKRDKPKIGLRKRLRAAALSKPALRWVGVTFANPKTPSPASASELTRSSSSDERQREAVPESTAAGDGPTRHYLVFSGPRNLSQAEPVGRIPGLASTLAPAEPLAPTRDCATTPAPGERAEINLGLAIAPGLATKRATDPASKPSRLKPMQPQQQQREQLQPKEAATEQFHESVGQSPGSSPATGRDPAGPADELDLGSTTEATSTVAAASDHNQAELNLRATAEPEQAGTATLALGATTSKRARILGDASVTQEEIDLTSDPHTSAETQPAGEPKRKPAKRAASELVLGSISDGHAFQGAEEIEANKIKQIFEAIMREMPTEWRVACCGEGSQFLPAAGLEAVVRKAWKTVGLSPIRNALRAMRWHIKICATFPTIPIYPVPASICAFACEEYDADALERGAQREKEAAAAGREPKGRGGATASSALRNGYWQFEHLLKLKIEASDPMVKAICAARGGMPTVRTMLPLEALWFYPHLSADETKSQYVRAYAAAAFIGVAGSLRVIDQQRTGSLHFEEHKVLDESVLIACGTTRKSKAGSQTLMKPLAWRAPLVALTEVDCGPLLASMPRKGGSMYRDFIVPAGFSKVITNAVGWADRPASHDTVVASQRALLSPYLGDARAASIGGHDQRHTIPEVGRGLGLPRHVREALGYWRAKAIVADTTGDLAAMARAVTVARGVKDRSGALASNADRYSSVDGAPVESDTARVTCLKAAYCVIRSGMDLLPTSTRMQIQKVADLVGAVPGEP